MAHSQFDTRSSELPGEFQQWLLELAETNEESLSRVRKNLVTAIQEELTPRQQEILHLLFFSGCPAREVARQLNVAPSTVTRTKQRALKNLARALRYSM